MADRDASRITITFPDLDYDGDGSVDSSSSFTACVFDGPNWSGFQKASVKTTCSSDTLNSWGNLIHTYRAGRVIDFGTLTVSVDWDPNLSTGGKPYAAFQDPNGGDYTVNIPANTGESAGPVITIPGHIESFTPQGVVLAEGDEARLAASIVLRINDAISFAIATT